VLPTKKFYLLKKNIYLLFTVIVLKQKGVFMKNMSPLLLNMPTDMAEVMANLGKQQQVSRTQVILKACRDYLNHQSNHSYDWTPPKTGRGNKAPTENQVRVWGEPDPIEQPLAFFSSGTRF
jgi:hypothetical protein